MSRGCRSCTPSTPRLCSRRPGRDRTTGVEYTYARPWGRARWASRSSRRTCSRTHTRARVGCPTPQPRNPCPRGDRGLPAARSRRRGRRAGALRDVCVGHEHAGFRRGGLRVRERRGGRVGGRRHARDLSRVLSCSSARATRRVRPPASPTPSLSAGARAAHARPAHAGPVGRRQALSCMYMLVTATRPVGLPATNASVAVESELRPAVAGAISLRDMDFAYLDNRTSLSSSKARCSTSTWTSVSRSSVHPGCASRPPWVGRGRVRASAAPAYLLGARAASRTTRGRTPVVYLFPKLCEYCAPCLAYCSISNMSTYTRLLCSAAAAPSTSILGRELSGTDARPMAS
jgi:hypothetical protein